jgi:thioesterase domain-containing protein
MSPMPDRPPRRPAPALVTTLADGGPAPRLQVHAVHPGAMPVTGWHGLAAELPGDVALHVATLDAIPEYLHAAADPAGRIELDLPGLAARVAAALPEQPGVPTVLVGWSFGGVLAYQLAVTAERRRQGLVLLDSIAPVPRFGDAERDLVDGDMLIRWFGMYLCAKRDAALPAGTVLRGDTEQDRLRLLLQWCVAAGVLAPETPASGFLKLYRTFLGGLSRNNRIVAGYRPPPAELPVALVKPAGSLLPDHGALGWPDLVGDRFTMDSCTGDHYTMLREPSVWRSVADLVMQHHFSRSDGTPLRRQAPASTS